MTNSKSVLNLKGVLNQPEKIHGIPNDAHWLAGEGAGSWFNFEKKEKGYLITRYSPTGKIECSSLFVLATNIPFDFNAPFKMQYLSHCSEVNVKQNNINLKFIVKK